MFAIVVAGFTPTFYLRPLFASTGYLDQTTDYLIGAKSLPWHLIVHGIVLTAWFLLVIVQAWLVASGRTRVHRQLGVVGAAIAIAVIATGMVTIVKFVPRMNALGETLSLDLTQVKAIIFTADFASLVIFALFVAAAVFFRRRPVTHKRLMVFAALAIIGPTFSSVRPVGRALAFLPVDPALTFYACCIVALVWHDRATRVVSNPRQSGQPWPQW